MLALMSRALCTTPRMRSEVRLEWNKSAGMTFAPALAQHQAELVMWQVAQMQMPALQSLYCSWPQAGHTEASVLGRAHFVFTIGHSC